LFWHDCKHVATAVYLLKVEFFRSLLDSWAVTSLGTLNVSDTISINTDTLQLTGGASYTGVLNPVSGAGNDIWRCS
jgi:hypothetical protein